MIHAPKASTHSLTQIPIRERTNDRGTLAGQVILAKGPLKAKPMAVRDIEIVETIKVEKSIYGLNYRVESLALTEAEGLGCGWPQAVYFCSIPTHALQQPL